MAPWQHRTPVLALAALAAAGPRPAPALVREVRTGPISALPVSVEPSPPYAQVWIDCQNELAASPVALTLSDGTRWHGDPIRPRWGFALGLGLDRFAGTFQLGQGSFGIAVEGRLPVNADLDVGVTAAALASFGGGYDFSVLPTVALRRPLPGGAHLVPFASIRIRGGQTLHDVQGLSPDRSSPFATAMTSDVGLAPILGVAAVTRFVELRLAVGREWLLLDRIAWEERSADLSRGGGFFGNVLLRLRLGSAR